MVPTAAIAVTETFERFEVVASTNYVVSQACPDGSTRPLRVTVLAGHEKGSENGETTSTRTS